MCDETNECGKWLDSETNGDKSNDSTYQGRERSRIWSNKTSRKLKCSH